MLYPQYFIDDLKNRADLVRIIQPYAQDLKKKGANWMACCPFHQEKTPSFSVNPAKGFYKCFGCGKGGTAYNFLMEMEGLSFPEAVKRVAEISGVMLPEPEDDQTYQRNKKKREQEKKLSDQIIELNQIAMEFWEAELQGNNKSARTAREYLSGRGISEEIQRTFRIGYSPDKWDALLKKLRDAGAADELIEQSGLVSVNEERDRTYDRFRGRIMFPVLDINGRPVAFGARALGSDEPKYLNSPETPAYTKGHHLYGLFQCRDAIRRRKFIILVEGYLDLIALHQAGIRNAAASLGTSLTPEQAKLLSRFARKVVINYDGDSAGIKAAKRAIEHLLPLDLEIKVLVLPDGKDPDDFVRENGADAYNDVRGRALPFMQFALDASLRGRNIKDPREKAAAIEDLLPIVAVIRNNIQRRETFDQAMELFHVDDSAIRRDLWQSISSREAVPAQQITQRISRAARAKVTVSERHLLELLVNDADMRSAVLPLLEASDYSDLATAEIFASMARALAAGTAFTPELLREQLEGDEDLLTIADDLLAAPRRREHDEPMDEALREAENCVVSLRDMAVARRSLEISREAAIAEQTGNIELFNRLTYEQLELEKIRRELQRQLAEV